MAACWMTSGRVTCGTQAYFSKVMRHYWHKTVQKYS